MTILLLSDKVTTFIQMLFKVVPSEDKFAVKQKEKRQMAKINQNKNPDLDNTTL